MKCTAMKLSSRQEQSFRKIWKENTIPKFSGEEGHSYSFPFLRPQTTAATTTPTTTKSSSLAITTINLPDNIPSFNTGASLDKWSKKRARLKSAKISKTPTEFDKEFCYETLETDLSLLLEDDDVPHSPDGSLDNLRYEVHSDIEKLLQETQRSAADNDNEPGRRRKKRGKEHKKKKSKTIKFSKTPSPQTEQVIRVDVTSNVAPEENKCREFDIKKFEREEEANKKNDEKERSHDVIDDKKMELKWNLDEHGGEMCDEDFIVRCRQLALRQRRRGLR